MNEISLESIITHAPGLFYFKNAKLEYVCCNKNFSSFLDLTNPSFIVGKTDESLIWSKFDLENFIRDDQRVINEQTEVSKKYRIPASGQELVWVNLTKKPWLNECHEVLGVIGSVEIIEDKKLKETQYLQYIFQQERERIRKKFKSTLIHQIQVPLSAIKVYAQILNKNLKDNTELAMRINDISDKASMALELSLINDSDDNQFEKVIVSESMNEIISARPFSDGEISLLTLSQRCDFSFLGNKILFKKVIFSLIKEGITMIKGKKDGLVEVIVEQINGKNCIKLINNGELVRKNRRPYLFESTDNGISNGILFLCKSILQEFKCGIEYEESSNKQNCFTLTFKSSVE